MRIWEKQPKRVYEPYKERRKSRMPCICSWKGNGVTVRFTFPEGKRVYPGIIRVFHKYGGRDRKQPISISSHGIVFDKAPRKGALIAAYYEVTL